MKTFIFLCLFVLTLNITFCKALCLNDSLSKNVTKVKTSNYSIYKNLQRLFFDQSNPDTIIKKAKQILLLIDKQSNLNIQANVLYNLGLAYHNKGDYDSAITSFSQSLLLDKRTNNQNGCARSYNAIGVTFRNTGFYEQALENFSQACSIYVATENDISIAEEYQNIANVYLSMDDFNNAIKFTQKALLIFNLRKDTIGISYNLNTTGIIYYKWGKFNDALTYFQKYNDYGQKLGDEQILAQSFNNLGMVYAELGQYKTSEKYYLAALAINKKNDNSNGIATVLNNIGEVYIKWKKYSTALNKFSEGLAITEKTGNMQSSATILYNIGTTYKELKKYNEAFEFYFRSINISKSLSYNSLLVDLYKSVYALYRETKNFEKALEYYEKYTEIKDSVLNSEKLQQISELKIKFETEKKDNENLVLVKQNEITKLQLNRNVTANRILIIAFILSIIFLIMFVRQIRIRSKQETSDLKQKLLRSQMNPHFIFNSLIAIQSFFYKKNIDEAAKYLSGFSKLTRLILENSREEYISLDKEIKTLQFYMELQELRFQDKFEFKIEIGPEIEIDSIGIPPMLAQPFIENAIEHGISTLKIKGLIKIRLIMEQKNIIFEIEDNGIGRSKAAEIREKSGEQHVSLAISITKERLVNLNRWKRKKIKLNYIDLFNKNGESSGTKVVFQIPYKII